MATYYVDKAVGSDANLGTSEGSGNAWLTLDMAMNTVAAGDLVYVKASATYTETCILDTAGTSALPIIFEGYTTTPGDGGQVTIDATGIASAITDSISASIYYVFKNLRFLNATSFGVDFSSTTHQCMWKNCVFQGNGSSGLSMGNAMILENCVFRDNGSHGASGLTIGVAIGCIFDGNGATGIRLSYGTVIKCLFYGNDSQAILFLGSNGFACVVDSCTIDGQSKDTTVGIQFPVSFHSPNVATNNIIYDCLTGIDGRDQGNRLVSRNNLLNSNTTNYATSYQTFEGELTVAPGFFNEAGEDYRLAITSAAIAAGYDATTIAGQPTGISLGAMQPVDNGGGGGGGVGIKSGGSL